MITIIAAILLALISGLFFGNMIHNYQVGKCNAIAVNSNQYYEAESNCYMVLEKPNWNLFWNSVIMFIISAMWLGIIVGIIGTVTDFYYDY